MGFFVKENATALMGMGKIDCYAWMRYNDWVCKDSREPTQRMIKAGHLICRISEKLPNGKYEKKTMITPSGKRFFTRRFKLIMDKYNCVMLYDKKVPGTRSRIYNKR